MKRKKILWIVIGLVLLLIVLAGIFKGGNSEIKVATEKVSKRNIVEIVSASGKIQPENDVKIAADVSGEITELMVAEGDTVRAGQLLFTINPEIYKSQADQLAANLDNSRANLASAEAQRQGVYSNFLQAQNNLERQKKLWEQKVISQQEYESALNAFEGAKANLNASDKNIQAARFSVNAVAAQLQQGQKNLGRTNVYAPNAGIVTNLGVRKGERVVGTAQMAGTEVMHISDLRLMEVQININENDIVRIKLGDSADIKVEAYKDRIFKGLVTEIANSAKFNVGISQSDQVTNFTVKVRILPSSYQDLVNSGRQAFFSGFTATVDIHSNSKQNVLTIPISSVTTRNPMKKDFSKKDKSKEDKTKAVDEKKEENKTYVFIYNNGTIKSVEVKTGLQDIDYFEITQGIKEGDEIVAYPPLAIAKLLNDGDKVKKVDKSKIYEK